MENHNVPDTAGPSGWAVSSLGEIATYVNGRAFKPSEWKQSGKPIIRIQNLTNQNAAFNYSPLHHEPKYAVKPGDLLFAWSASLGAHFWRGDDAWLNQHIFNVHPRTCTTKPFLFYLLKYITADLYAKTHGSGMVHVTKDKFEATQVYLPPLSEQRRIVAKMEELFSELDDGIESLKTAREQLKVYRQALLKHAFEGKLTAAWRAENPDKLASAEALLQRIHTEREERYEQHLADWQEAVRLWEAGGSEGRKPAKPSKLKDLPPLAGQELAELPELPAGWGWVRLGEIFADSPKNGLYKPADYYGTGVSIIRIDDFYDGHLIKKAGFKRVQLTPEEANAFAVAEGDVLVNRVNSIEYLGKCCEVRSLMERAVFESNIMKLTLSERFVSTTFVTHYLAGHPGRKRLCSNAKHAVNQASINQTDVASTPIPIASVAEQTAVAEVLASRLSLIAGLEEGIRLNLRKSEALRQSILKKAFSGQLVPQDSDDEPASVLLERIRIEKAVTNNGRSHHKAGR